jgi:hypothetical protein
VRRAAHRGPFANLPLWALVLGAGGEDKRKNGKMGKWKERKPARATWEMAKEIRRLGTIIMRHDDSAAAITSQVSASKVWLAQNVGCLRKAHWKWFG